MLNHFCSFLPVCLPESSLESLPSALEVLSFSGCMTRSEARFCDFGQEEQLWSHYPTHPSLILREKNYTFIKVIPLHFSLPLLPAIPASCGSAAVQQPGLHALCLNKNEKSRNSISLTKMCPCMESPVMVVSSWRRNSAKKFSFGGQRTYLGAPAKGLKSIIIISSQFRECDVQMTVWSPWQSSHPYSS